MNNWQDRIVDVALQELHGQRPPDLTQRVLLAMQEQAPGPLPVLRRRSARGLGAYLAAAAMLLAALAVASYGLREQGPGSTSTVARLEITVFAGEIRCSDRAADPSTTIVGQGEVGTFTARTGNRLFARVSSQARLDVFATIATEPSTELEVRSMEYSLKNGAVAASALTLSVVAGVVTWHTLTRSGTAKAGEVVRLEAPDQDSAGLTAENAELRQRILQLERQNEQLRTMREAVPVEPAPVPVLVEPPEAEVAAPAVTFDDPRYADALAKIDWQLVGATSKDMQPLLVELAKQVAEGGEVSTELAIEIQKLNTKLLEQLPAILEAKLPGFGANGAYTHPLVVANSLASTLEAAGQPLDPAQRSAIEGLVRLFSIENQSVEDSQHEFAAEHMLAEIEMKERFYREVGTRLTPEQFAMLYPEGSLAHDGISLFSTGLMTRPFVAGVPARDAAEFARSTSGRLSQELELDEAATEKVRGIIESMSSRASGLWSDPTDRTESELHMMRSGRTLKALRHQIAMLREISRQVTLTPAQKKKLENLTRVIVPLPR